MRKLMLLIAVVTIWLPASVSAQGQRDHKQHGEHMGHGSTEDANFLDGFSKHHEDGIKMAEMALSKAASADVKKMSEKMIKDQTSEIDQMKKWRNEHLSGIAQTHQAPPAMDMSSLEGKLGKEFDRAYLEMMVKHHEDGVKMAKKAQPSLKIPDVKKFASTAAKKQSDEMTKMNKMMKSL